MLPGLISIVEHCSEQNCDLKNFLNTYEQSWLKDTVYHKALLRLLRHLAQTDDSNPKTMMMILEYIALQEHVQSETMREVADFHARGSIDPSKFAMRQNFKLKKVLRY